MILRFKFVSVQYNIEPICGLVFCLNTHRFFIEIAPSPGTKRPTRRPRVRHRAASICVIIIIICNLFAIYIIRRSIAAEHAAACVSNNIPRCLRQRRLASRGSGHVASTRCQSVGSASRYIRVITQYYNNNVNKTSASISQVYRDKPRTGSLMERETNNGYFERLLCFRDKCPLAPSDSACRHYCNRVHADAAVAKLYF